jgi:hypothetical protein
MKNSEDAVVLLGILIVVVMAVLMMVMMTGVQIMTDGDHRHGGDFNNGDGFNSRNDVLMPVF